MVAARAILSLALLFSAEAALAAADVEARREVALTWCASCHVVGAAKPHGGIDSTPSFFLMSERLDNAPARADVQAAPAA
jgi:mono/diheme cytochrome c family protein